MWTQCLESMKERRFLPCVSWLMRKKAEGPVFPVWSSIKMSQLLNLWHKILDGEYGSDNGTVGDEGTDTESLGEELDEPMDEAIAEKEWIELKKQLEEMRKAMLDPTERCEGDTDVEGLFDVQPKCVGSFGGWHNRGAVEVCTSLKQDKANHPVSRGRGRGRAGARSRGRRGRGAAGNGVNDRGGTGVGRLERLLFGEGGGSQSWRLLKCHVLFCKTSCYAFNVGHCFLVCITLNQCWS